MNGKEDPTTRMRRWNRLLAVAAATLIVASVGYFLFFAALRSMNQYISRCMDESAPQYIADRDQRSRECDSQ
jgi:hypothetical protein